MNATTSRSVTRLRRGAMAVLATAALLAAAGCGGDESSSSNTPAATTSEDTSLSAKVPAKVKSAGTITIGTDATYAPNEFLDADGKTVIGMDVDLFNAVAAKLGLKTDWVPAAFDAIIPGVQCGKYDDRRLVSFTINAEREQAGQRWSATSTPAPSGSTQKGNPQKVNPDNACGKNVAVQKGTVQVDEVTARSKKCTDAGKPAITIVQYAGQDTGHRRAWSVRQGRRHARRLAGHRLRGQADQRHSSSCSATSTTRPRTATCCQGPRPTSARPSPDALKALTSRRHVRRDPQQVGREAGAISNFAVNPSVG